MGAEDRIVAPDVVPVAERGVERATFPEVLYPGLRVVTAEFDFVQTVEVGLAGVDAQQHVHTVARETDRNLVTEKHVDVLVGTILAPGGCAIVIELVDDGPAGTQHACSRMLLVLDFEHDQAARSRSAPEVPSEHAPEVGIVVKGQRSTVYPDESATTRDEVHDRALPRILQRQVAVRHHHQAVELGQVLGRDHRQVQLLLVLQVPLQGGHLESGVASPRCDGTLRRPQARVFVERRMSEEEQLLRRLLLWRAGCGRLGS